MISKYAHHYSMLKFNNNKEAVVPEWYYATKECFPKPEMLRETPPMYKWNWTNYRPLESRDHILLIFVFA